MTRTQQWLVAPNAAQLIPTAAAIVAAQIRAVVAARGTCRLALAGGNTPAPLYALWAKGEAGFEVPFAQVTALFGDERFVPHDHADSNYRSAREHLLSRVPALGAVHPMTDGADDPDAAARAYEAHLQDPIDVLLLGMGPDGHIASLFPHSPAFASPERLALAVIGPKPPPQRITITPRVIAAARHVFVLVTGADKAEAVSQAMSATGVSEALPATLVREAFWLLDAPAASQLTR
ncbi:MAG: 6-phosphogluconolactonase [Proteobacteria bacterium]|nr:6-phosphogluconolactonase [Pseudomonadota bacterium]